ncbi:50S ribosomal protein L24 [Nanoarchaeota archaeon]
MKKKFSRLWKSSSRPNKQRKYLKKAPLHTRVKFVSSALSKDLRKKYSKRSIPARVGDKILVNSGGFKGKTGKISRVDRKSQKIFIEGFEVIKKEGAKVPVGIHSSNLTITELNLDDKKRERSLKLKTPLSDSTTEKPQAGSESSESSEGKEKTVTSSTKPEKKPESLVTKPQL